MTPVETWGENKTDLPTSSKWQIGLFLWQKVARRETERSAASAKRAVTTHRGIPKGTALGAPLVTFPATGKSPGCRAERLHRGCWGCQPRKNSRARGGAPAHRESAEDGRSPPSHRPAGAVGRSPTPSPPQQIKITFTFYPFCAILNRYKQTALPGENRTPWKGRNQDVSCSKRKGGL